MLLQTQVGLPAACFRVCPHGYTQSFDDPYECMASAETLAAMCPAGTTFDRAGLQCTKDEIQQPSGGCPPDTSQWQEGKCFVDCPESFLDEGLSCKLPTRTRTSTPPTCAVPFFYMRDLSSSATTCTLRPWVWSAMSIVVLGLFVAACLATLAQRSSLFKVRVRTRRR